jgi:hypothetical protein
MDRGNKLVGIALLQERYKGAGFHDLQSGLIGHASHHHEDLYFKPTVLQVANRREPRLFAEIVVEQDNIRGRVGERRDGVRSECALTDNPKALSRFEKPARLSRNRL